MTSRENDLYVPTRSTSLYATLTGRNAVTEFFIKFMYVSLHFCGFIRPKTHLNWDLHRKTAKVDISLAPRDLHTMLATNKRLETKLIPACIAMLVHTLPALRK